MIIHPKKCLPEIGFTIICAAALAVTGCAGEKKSAVAVTPIQIDDHTWRIDDKGANIYLIVGEKKALVLDTGYGSFDPTPTIRNLTSLPLIAANTHYHHDHTSGNRYFREIYTNPDDQIFLNRLYNAIFSIKVHALKDGDVIDLGGRTLSVFVTPGHSAGSLCLYDVQNGFLFSGDTCNNRVWLFFNDSTTVERFLKTLRRLDADTATDVRLLPGHGDIADKALIAKQTRCAENVLAGETGEKNGAEGHGEGLIYSFENASLVYNPERIR